jgi:hypothetical protein
MTYDAITQLSDSQNIDTKLLRLAKSKHLPGFNATNIDWNKLKPALETRMDELIAELPDFNKQALLEIAGSMTKVIKRL